MNFYSCFDQQGQIIARCQTFQDIEVLKKMSDDFEDVNYHSEAGPLYYAIQLLKIDDKAKAEIYITKFIMECRDALNKNKIYYGE